MKRYQPLFEAEVKKDGSTWKTKKGYYAGKHNGEIQYFSKEEGAKAYASKGTSNNPKSTIEEPKENKPSEKAVPEKEQFQGNDHYEKQYNDPIAMDELELSVENDGDLYRQQFQPIIKNLQRKIKSGKYNHELAPKLWMYYVDNGAKKYAKENGISDWHQVFTKKDRMVLAKKLADYHYDEIKNGQYD